MAAPKGEKELVRLFDAIIVDISENGVSLKHALKKRMSTATFYELLKDDNKLKMYARATEDRADKIADEILMIADNTEGDKITLPDGREVTNHDVVNRDRLRVDARKWLLAKLNPKKYGDKVDVTSGNQPITNVNVTYIDKIITDTGE
ncbi:MAG: hypothetical protein M0R74_17780 [Dehalococcoidia bacterium]|jgi:hypothetical protein|nr:hypothetical protein [Dehalococcoidia bacterium]